MLKPQSPCGSKVFPSPNHGERVGTTRPDMLVLHYTGMPVTGEALQWLCNPVSQVSCHYFVFEDGHTLQLVPEERRAWHAGRSFWRGETDLNSCSIGIEIAHPGHDAEGDMAPYPAVQIEAVIALTKDIATRWNIAPQRVLAHSDIAPQRKLDPGEAFPWEKLYQAGIGHYVEPAPLQDGRFFVRGEEGLPIEALQMLFAHYGYDMPITGVFCEKTEAVIKAFQRHFRPTQVDGVADASTIKTLKALIDTQPSRLPLS